LWVNFAEGFWQFMAFKVKFWGVRGSLPCPSRQHVRFGGNTSCVEVQLGLGQRLIFDAGTGLRALGQEMLAHHNKSALLLLTHTHWDHVCGFPFFAPAYLPDFSFDILAGHLPLGQSIQSVLAGQMMRPLFPVPIEIMRAKLRFHDFQAGQSLALLPGVSIDTCMLQHPDGAVGYRVNYNGASLCYITDTEHHPGRLDNNILALIKDADLVIYDSTFTDETFGQYVGWGHSTWQEGIRLCLAAGVKRLALFHHAPDHDDRMMVRIERAAKRLWPGAFAAREGMEIILTPGEV
jgi:phosphoribosyl 1,2-cyclic phosphodiesterase